jgi:hypothetical protein
MAFRVIVGNDFAVRQTKTAKSAINEHAITKVGLRGFWSLRWGYKHVGIVYNFLGVFCINSNI